jgi:hypothetical protein
MAGQLQVSFSPILVILLFIFVALFAIYVYQHGVVADVAKKSEGFREGKACPNGCGKGLMCNSTTGRCTPRG